MSQHRYAGRGSRKEDTLIFVADHENGMTMPKRATFQHAQFIGATAAGGKSRAVAVGPHAREKQRKDKAKRANHSQYGKSNRRRRRGHHRFGSKRSRSEREQTKCDFDD